MQYTRRMLPSFPIRVRSGRPAGGARPSTEVFTREHPARTLRIARAYPLPAACPYCAPYPHRRPPYGRGGPLRAGSHADVAARAPSARVDAPRRRSWEIMGDHGGGACALFMLGARRTPKNERRSRPSPRASPRGPALRPRRRPSPRSGSPAVWAAQGRWAAAARAPCRASRVAAARGAAGRGHTSASRRGWCPRGHPRSPPRHT